jgi:hypothetical protein
MDGRHTRYFEIAYILLLPIAVWLLYQFSPFNNNDGFLDPWIYFGYVHNFQDLIERYGLIYYFSVRFGFIFPLIALVKIFGPISGYVMFVYALYLLAGVPLYLLFRKWFSVHAAILAYAILVSSVWFARTVLWTYPDASAVPYLVAALGLMFLEPKRRRLGNFAVGLLVGLAANSNIFALSLGGLSGVAYSVNNKNSLWARLRQDIPWMAAGFVLIFTGGMVGYYMCCQQMNFLNSTLAMIKWSIEGSAHIYQVSFLALLKLNYLYLLPFLMLSIVPLLRKVDRRDRSICFAALSYLGAAIFFFIWFRFAAQSALLETFYYFSFLLVPCILCMALVPVLLARASTSESQNLNIAIASFLVPPLIFTYGFPTSMDSISVYWVCLNFAFTLFLIFLAIRVKKITAYAIVCFALSIQISLVSTVSPSAAFRGVPFYARMYGIPDETGLSRYRLGLKFIESMPKFKEDRRPVYFWYTNADKLANSLQSTYLWSATRVMGSNQETHGLPSLTGMNLDSLRRRSSLVLFDRDRKIVDQGIEELRRLGIRFAINKTREICEKEICYFLVVLNVSADNQKVERSWKESRNLNVALDWGQPGEGAEIRREGTNTSIMTPSKAWNYGAVATMRFSEEPPTRRGLVRVLVIVKEAIAGLGFLSSNESSFIKRLEIHPMNEPQEIYFEFANLSELRKFVIQTWDLDKSAQVQLLEFSVRETPSSKQ